MAVGCSQEDGDIELSYDSAQEGWQSDAARKAGALSCPKTQPRSRGVAARCCHGDGDIELSYDPAQDGRQSDTTRETKTFELAYDPASGGVAGPIHYSLFNISQNYDRPDFTNALPQRVFTKLG